MTKGRALEALLFSLLSVCPIIIITIIIIIVDSEHARRLSSLHKMADTAMEDIKDVSSAFSKSKSKGKGKAKAGDEAVAGANGGPDLDLLPWCVEVVCWALKLGLDKGHGRACCDWLTKWIYAHTWAGSKSIARQRWTTSCPTKTLRRPVCRDAAACASFDSADIRLLLSFSTVERFIDKSRLPHLLFYGPPGTGKTSTILAMARKIYGANFKNNVLEVSGSCGNDRSTQSDK